MQPDIMNRPADSNYHRILRGFQNMKKIFAPALVFAAFGLTAQEHFCAKHKQTLAPQTTASSLKSSAAPAAIPHEHNYDVKFVHLDLQVERTNKFIAGGVRTIAQVTSASLDTFMTILHINHSVDSVRFNGSLVTVVRQDSMVKCKTPVTLSNGSTFTVNVYYKGTAPSGGSAIGSGFSNATSPSWLNQVTWSLSQAFVGYHWWPCKQALTDKIDSSWVFITTDSTNMAGSNGLLTNIVTVGAKKRYEWKSRKPIDYYLISVAVAKYKEYRQYAKPQYLQNDSILIQNYIYDNAINANSWINTQKIDLDKVPAQINFLSKMYGMYPYYKEKYGHCMAPLGGGMEHQTMSTMGFFEYYINAHELGHQWWGNQVTCKTWRDIWINEGFASYTEHLVAEYLDPPNFQANLNTAHNNVMGSPGGSVRIPVQDSMKTSRIFSSRLTYDKGGAIIHTLRFVTNNDSLWFNTLRGFQSQYKNSTASADDFFSYYHTSTGIDPAIFVNQWFDGEGYPTFSMRYNYNGTHFFLRSTQSVSMPGVTPLFITPMQYRIARFGKPDTIIRVMHSNAVENYTVPMTGSVTNVYCDPKNWVINDVGSTLRDTSLGPKPDLSAIHESEFQSISIGPNPVKNTAVLNCPSVLQGEIRLYDMTGRLLKSVSVSKRTEISMSDLPQGAYQITVYDRDGNGRFSSKILKE
jgi:aminopeptidase N